MDEPALNGLRKVVLALLGLLTAASLIGGALAPYLLVKAPLLLVAISAAAHHVVLAAASVDPWLLVLVATVRRVVTCVAAYGLGFFYGRGALGWLERRYPALARSVEWVEGQLGRRGVWLLVAAPTSGVALLAGAARIRFTAFLVAVGVGQAMWIGATVYVGDAIAVYTERATAFVGQHLLESTLVCVALVVLQQARARVLRRRRLPSDAPLSGS